MNLSPNLVLPRVAVTLRVRPFAHGDLDNVMAIEKASFPDPYDQLFFRWLKLKVGEGFIVAEEGGIVGYAISEVSRRRGHIISMAVSPERRRSGVGTALLEELISRLEPLTRDIYLEVRASNRTAILLYEKFLFKVTGEVRRQYYPDWEDAVIME